jgi:hypothetical protein
MAGQNNVHIGIPLNGLACQGISLK